METDHDAGNWGGIMGLERRRAWRNDMMEVKEIC